MRRFMPIMAALISLLAISACGPGTSVSTPEPAAATPKVEAATATPGAEPTVTTSSSYPKIGHAPDYSWVAGRVTFTMIQGGCIYIYTDPAEIQAFEASLTPQPTTSPAISGPFVSTAVGGSTSLPLRDITPEVGPPPTQPPTSRFVPSGPGWDQSKVKDGDYVVLIGRLAGQDDPREICPGGTHYVADKMLLNP